MRSILNPNPAKQSVIARERTLQLRWLLPVIAALLGALAYIFWRASPQDMGDAQSLLTRVVSIGSVLGFLLVLTVPLVYARLRAAALKGAEGVYVEFAGRRMRTLAVGDTLWLHAEDVHAVLGLPPHFKPRNLSAQD
jgi:hypothetical protein